VKSLGDPPNISKFSIVVSKIYEAKEKGRVTEAINDALRKANVKGEIASFSETGGTAAEEIKRGTWTAIIVATIVILLYITIRFNFVFGVGAIVALIHDVMITLGFFSFSGYEINVPAVAALLTLIGYSLNDTIVVCDRIRENMKRYRGRSIESIVNQSINEVIVRTINTSLTTFMVVFMLFLFAGKVIKPFAFGMVIGTIVGTYSSLYIAAPIVIRWVKPR
ncbi:MAG: protein translocase subunit SecF, partial [Thermotogae bacterium]